MLPLAPRPLVAPDLGLQLADGKEAEHLPVAGEGPQRVGEGGRAVVLDQEMRQPGEGVAGHHGGQQQPPVAEQGGGQQQRQAKTGAGQVDRPGQRLAVLAQIEGPELGIGLDRTRHGLVPCNAAGASVPQTASGRG